MIAPLLAYALLTQSGGALPVHSVRAKPASQPLAAQLILESARRQLSPPAVYDASYQRLSYPGGDVPADRGACSDVIVRALRWAGYDLQKLIHEDIKKGTYPRVTGKRDKNIDHRRVANQVVYFARFGQRLSIAAFRPERFKPGDFVTWKLPNNLDHIGIISDRKVDGRPLVIHNIAGAAEEDVLIAWRMTGHYRFPKPGS